MITRARMVGRWKSGMSPMYSAVPVSDRRSIAGAPIALTPFKDEPARGADPQWNNNFDFSKDHTQDSCPFAAHIRKTNPRSDQGGILGGSLRQRMWRRGIPFGPEV